METLKELNLNDIITCTSFVICGMRGSGKTWIARNIVQTMFNNKIIDELIVIAPNKSYVYHTF